MRPIPWRSTAWRAYAAAAGLVVLAVALGVVFRRLPHANLSLLFLLAVLLVAARWGLAPSLFACVLGFVALNYFFTPPYYTFAVEEQGDLATLVFFVAMAALTANLAARARAEMANNRAALDRVSTLLDFSRRMAAAPDARQVLELLADQAASIAAAPAAAFLTQGGRGLSLTAVSRSPGTGTPPDAGAVAAACGDHAHPARVAGWTCLPIVTSRARLGVLALAPGELRHQQRQLIDGLSDQAAVALERIELANTLRTAQVLSETEQLRSALLSSVSHDLRTPLAAIIGSATSLLEYAPKIQESDRASLLRTVRDESQRLDRYIQNLLDMTRFGQQEFEPKREWTSLHDLIGSAIERLGALLGEHQVAVEVAPAVGLLYVQGALIEQALVNLLDNAAGFGPAGTPITVRAYLAENAIRIEVADRGPGIPAEERDKIFDMFYRARHGDRHRHGAGLGLAICRSLIAAHGGTIEALPLDSTGGTLMRITLPTAQNPVGAARA